MRERGGRYDDEVQRAMMGMSSTEWSRYLHDVAGVPDEPAAINDEVVRRMLDAYREHLPLIDGAVDAVRRLAARYPLGLASSSNRPLIDAVLELAGLAALLRGDGLVGGGRARQARTRRLPRGGAAARRRRGSAAPRSRTRTAASARRRRPACA